MRISNQISYPLVVCAAVAVFAGCTSGGTTNSPLPVSGSASEAPSSWLTPPGPDVMAKRSHWGIEYKEIASAWASAGRSQEQIAGFCSGGRTGYHCHPLPITTLSAPVPSISVYAFEEDGMSRASANASGNGAIALGSASANLAAAASADGIAAARAVGQQSFTWFDEVLPPHATRAHPKGTAIRFSATLSASGDSYNLPCNLGNYFVALASAANRPQLNQPGGCTENAPGKPRAKAIWKTLTVPNRFGYRVNSRSILLQPSETEGANRPTSQTSKQRFISIHPQASITERPAACATVRRIRARENNR